MALPRAREWDRRLLPQGLDLAKIACSCHFALELLCSSLHDDSLGTTVHGVSNWYGTIVTLVTSTCCSAKQTFVSVCMQKKSLCATGEWFPTFTDFIELVLPSCTLFTRLGSVRSTFTYKQLLNFMCLVFIYRSGHAITKSHLPFFFFFFGGRASS